MSNRGAEWGLSYAGVNYFIKINWYWLLTPLIWIPKLLYEFHDSPTGGHAGAFQTYRRLVLNVYWNGMFR